ncbi:hypothetical protein [Streptomyces sp. NPDC057686]|uniref:hypothetical protein n=1 Tax=Streptomyces sp. NPDC057686 TaxID=3346212 RepID=UPI0036AEF103
MGCLLHGEDDVFFGRVGAIVPFGYGRYGDSVRASSALEKVCVEQAYSSLVCALLPYAATADGAERACGRSWVVCRRVQAAFVVAVGGYVVCCGEEEFFWCHDWSPGVMMMGLSPQ